MVNFAGLRRIVGVVGSIRHDGPETNWRRQGYLPIDQTRAVGATLMLRLTRDAGEVLPAVKTIVWSQFPGIPMPDVEMLSTYLAGLVAPRRFNMLLLNLFGVIGIVIACIGIYGVMAYGVALRTNEIGIRMALGAVPAAILRSILGRAMTYLGAGLAIGLLCAWSLASLVSGFLFEVEPHDLSVYAGESAVLIVTGVTCGVPSRPSRIARRSADCVAARVATAWRGRLWRTAPQSSDSSAGSARQSTRDAARRRSASRAPASSSSSHPSLGDSTRRFGTRFRRRVTEALRRLDVGVEPVRGRTIGRGREVEAGAAPERRDVRCNAIPHRNQRRHRPGRVSGRVDEGQRGIPKRQLLTIGDGDVALRFWKLGWIAGLEIPVRGGHQHPRAESLLENRRASGVIPMRMADGHVLDLRRIEAKLLQATNHLRLDRIVEDRVDDDDAGGGGDGPRRVVALADVIQVVEHLHRLARPGRRGWRRRQLAAVGWSGRCRSGGWCRGAQIDEGRLFVGR